MGEVTRLLEQWTEGKREAEAPLFELLYPELRRIAHSILRTNGRDATLQPTALVNELYLRLVRVKDRTWTNRRAFFRYAAVAMRRLLIDHWRRRGATLIPLGNLAERADSKETTIEVARTVSGLLDDLAKEHPDWASVVEMKFFLGLDNRAVAESMRVSLRTVERIWQDARWFLYERVGPKK